jgi:hypothetical protein
VSLRLQFANIFIQPKQIAAVVSTNGALFIKKTGLLEENSKQFHKIYKLVCYRDTIVATAVAFKKHQFTFLI